MTKMDAVDNRMERLNHQNPVPMSKLLSGSLEDKYPLLPDDGRTIIFIKDKGLEREILLWLVQVIHVLDEQSINEALKISEKVDALLLDSGNPNLAVKELGGTGRTHNWVLSRKIVEQVRVPVFLAGGLNAGNVREAIEVVQPYAVDVCSGVRSDGKLDEQKLEAFLNAVWRN
jgi:phosphoribosylanthranilate isomerase